MASYLERLAAQLEQRGLRCPLYLMTSGGGLTTLETARRFPVRLVESGPAGGAILSAGLARENGLPVISIAGYARRSDLAIMVDANTGAKNVKELAGKKIVSFTGSPWVPFIKPFTRAASLSDEQFAVTMVAPPAMVSTYASGNADAFLSLAGLCLGAGLEPEIAAFVGSAAAAIDVQIVCNREPVSLVGLQKYVGTLLK